ncbi:MAG: HIT domain-containing protein [Oscillospiraceae bacterium]|nr:HIT domain-containing protein [Oscillospiraceae bacterium]
MNCIFCKIINGDVPSMKVYEDEYSVVFMDIAGDVDGHMLAVPKKHVKNILDCDAETLQHLIDAVKKVSNHCVEHCGYDGVNLLNASDESAGQSVPHFHFHLIPRKNEDEIDAWPQFKGAKHEIDKIYQKLVVVQD